MRNVLSFSVIIPQKKDAIPEEKGMQTGESNYVLYASRLKSERTFCSQQNLKGIHFSQMKPRNFFPFHSNGQGRFQVICFPSKPKSLDQRTVQVLKGSVAITVE